MHRHLAVLATTTALVLPAVPAAADGTLVASPVKRWSTSAVTLVAGDTWSRGVKVAGGKREIKLQVKAGGPFRTVKTYRTKANGKVTVKRTFPTPGAFRVRLILVGQGGDKDVRTRPVAITVVASAYAGTFGGEHTSGTRWSGDLRYQFQARDPVTNQPWNDGQVHYTPIEGTVSWQFETAGLTNANRRDCSATPSAGVLPVDQLDGSLEIATEAQAQGRPYRLSLDVPIGKSPVVQLTCEYLVPDPDNGDTWEPRTSPYSLDFGPEGDILLTNALSVAATGVGGQFTKGGSLTGDITRPAEALTNRWYWDLAVR